MTPEQLEAIEGIGPKTVEKISLAVNNYFATLDAGAVIAEGEVASEDVAEVAPEEGAIAPEAAADEDVTGEIAVAGEVEVAPEGTTEADTLAGTEDEQGPEVSPAPEKTE